MPLLKTALGLKVMRKRPNPLNYGQRQALALFDGEYDTHTVLDLLNHLGLRHADVQHMVDKGWLRERASLSVNPAEGLLLEQPETARYAAAYPIAVRLTSRLGLRGIRLKMSVLFSREFQDLQALGPKILDKVGEQAYAPLAKYLRP